MAFNLLLTPIGIAIGGDWECFHCWFCTAISSGTCSNFSISRPISVERG